MFWVTMIDNFMSGWGPAEGKFNAVVVRCDTYSEAHTVTKNARAREEMSDLITVPGERPEFDESKFFVQYEDRDSWPSMFKEEEEPCN